MMHETDVELVRRWQAGEAEAFAGLVRRWERPMARFLHHLTGRAESVPDLCQEVFLRVHRSRTGYRAESQFSTWLFKIGLNVARDAGRRRRPQLISLNGKLTDSAGKVQRDGGEHAEAADDICARKERGRIVVEALATLPEPLRVVLVLRHYEEMSFEEIGRVTGTAASTLKSRFGVALRRLKSELQLRGIQALDS